MEGGLDKEAVLVLPLKMTSSFLYFFPLHQRSKAKVRVARSTPLNPFSSSPRRPLGGEKGGDFSGDRGRNCGKYRLKREYRGGTNEVNC